MKKTKKSITSTVVERAKAPTPGFFKKLRNIGLLLASVSTVVLTAPIGLPVAIVTAAGYLGVAGGVMSAVSQLTVQSPNP
jgi:hypothetical protein